VLRDFKLLDWMGHSRVPYVKVRIHLNETEICWALAGLLEGDRTQSSNLSTTNHALSGVARCEWRSVNEKEM